MATRTNVSIDGWTFYYELLVKYEGDLEMATLEETAEAEFANPNYPQKSLQFAKDQYTKEWGKPCRQ